MNANDADTWHALGLALVALGNLFFDTGRLGDALRCYAAAAHDESQSQGEA